MAYITDDGQKKDYPELDKLYKKVCHLTNCHRNQIENLMVVKYEASEHYYNHHDYFKTDANNMLKDGGQRIASFFVYLNTLDSDAGGETEFPLIDLKIKPVAGTAVFWWNQVNGNLQELTLHRGNPPITGLKYGLNIWIREKGW